jgi:hypothetical protein
MTMKIGDHRFISAEALRLIFPELDTRIDELPCQVTEGQKTYDSIAALDLALSLRPASANTKMDEAELTDD